MFFSDIWKHVISLQPDHFIQAVNDSYQSQASLYRYGEHVQRDDGIFLGLLRKARDHKAVVKFLEGIQQKQQLIQHEGTSKVLDNDDGDQTGQMSVDKEVEPKQQAENERHSHIDNFFVRTLMEAIETGNALMKDYE